MQGFVNRAVQCFVRDTYGWAVWLNVVRRAGLGFTNFEAMLVYSPHITENIVVALEIEFKKPRSIILEDLGTYLVTSPTTEVLRRMLRFGGEDFGEFILSLDELPDRARLALAEIELPSIQLHSTGAKQYLIEIGEGLPGFSWALVGVLRALADDYGALAFIEHKAGSKRDQISVVLADDSFSHGRHFELAPAQYATG